jgi:hypothetical protein
MPASALGRTTGSGRQSLSEVFVVGRLATVGCKMRAKNPAKQPPTMQSSETRSTITKSAYREIKYGRARATRVLSIPRLLVRYLFNYTKNL